MLRLLCLFLLLSCGVLCTIGGCQGPQNSGESHFGTTKAFLRVCEDGGCGSGDTCVCAVCTVPCEGVAECRRRIGEDVDLPANIMCRGPMCGDNVNDENNPGAGSVCDVACADDTDCAFLDRDHDGLPHFCNGGFCRTLELPDGPVEVPSEPPVLCPSGMELVPGSALPSGLGLCMDRSEVTVEQYAACVTDGACAEPESGNFLTAGRERHPINFVSEADAEALCAFRGLRLPTLEEWHAAASRGAESEYPWGDEVPTVDDDPQRVCGLGLLATCEVESFPAGENAWRHADLAGNVAEWVTTADGHCAAGGSFESAADQLTAESCVAVDMPAAGVGLRCVRDL